jgi:hypothetical protein
MKITIPIDVQSLKSNLIPLDEYKEELCKEFVNDEITFSDNHPVVKGILRVEGVEIQDVDDRIKNVFLKLKNKYTSY